MRRLINGEETRLKLPATIIDVCCDCKLTHFTSYNVESNTLIIKTFRDDYLTKKHRKRKK